MSKIIGETLTDLKKMFLKKFSLLFDSKKATYTIKP